MMSGFAVEWKYPTELPHSCVLLSPIVCEHSILALCHNFQSRTVYCNKRDYYINVDLTLQMVKTLKCKQSVRRSVWEWEWDKVSRRTGQTRMKGELSEVQCPVSSGMSVPHRVAATHQVDNWLPTWTSMRHSVMVSLSNDTNLYFCIVKQSHLTLFNELLDISDTLTLGEFGEVWVIAICQKNRNIKMVVVAATGSSSLQNQQHSTTNSTVSK